MRALFVLMCASLLLAVPASAESRQAGIICNSVDAISAAAYFRYFGDANETKQVAWLVSTPTKWCIPGFVRESRPNNSKTGLEHVQADLDESYAQLQFVGDLTTSLIPGLNIFGSLIKMMPNTTLDLREFEREDGHTGYYITVVEKIPDTVLEQMRRDVEAARAIERKQLGMH